MSADIINVVAAVQRRDDRFCVFRRKADDKFAGMWEYPGGKVEAGEELEGALARELWEEFGVPAEIGQMLAAIEATHAGKRYRVHFFATRFIGEPELRVHDLMQWCTLEEMDMQDHLPSGVLFNAALRLKSVSR